MFIGQILSGNWDTGWLEITGMPKDFVLSARKLVVMEEKEYHELVSDRCKWKNAYEEDDIRTNGLCEKVQRLTAENKVKANRIEEFEKLLKIFIDSPHPGELIFDPEDPMCPVCHESLRLMDGCEWSDNPIENSCRECLFDYIDRLTAENKAKDEKARLFHLEVQEAILEVQEAIEALIGCEDDKSLKGE